MQTPRKTPKNQYFNLKIIRWTKDIIHVHVAEPAALLFRGGKKLSWHPSLPMDEHIEANRSKQISLAGLFKDKYLDFGHLIYRSMSVVHMHIYSGSIDDLNRKQLPSTREEIAKQPNCCLACILIYSIWFQFMKVIHLMCWSMHDSLGI